MNAQSAFTQLNPQHWAETSVIERLSLIGQIQGNLKKFAEELGKTDAKMKNELIGEEFVTW